MKSAAGNLRRVITIKAPPTGQDAAGQPISDPAQWTVVCTARAHYMATNGMGVIRAERQEAGIEVSTSSCSWRIRWRTGITPAMRVEETLSGVTRVWDIKQVLPDLQDRDFVDLVCQVGGVQ
jgi:head-tail adaptor